jgi:DNA invertase Pin-like site-specific DNA recombinase/predicted transport protein
MSTQPKSTGPKNRCAIYTRKSCEEGLDLEFNSLHAQRESAEAFIASQQHEGWECLPDRYDDGGFSGGSLERPALNRLLEDIKTGRIDCVVVYKVDRLSRSLLDFSRIMETFDKHGVCFVSVTQQFNTTHSMGRLTLNILLSFAQFEREIIGERIRDKIAAQRRKGKWAGGVPILGYDVDRTNASPKLVINAEEAVQVRRIFSLYQELGSLLPVVNEVNKRGWQNKVWKTKKGLTRGGKSFDKCSIYSLLTNPLYAGLIRHKDLLHKGEHENLIAPEVFEAVQKQLKQNGRGKGNHLINKHGALLKGLLHCSACDRAMVHTFTQKDEKLYTIEHIMPQNEKLPEEWQTMLGKEWKKIQATWLHRLGNLTLTGYNSTYSDRPFEDKKTIPGGFNESSVRLNKFVREQLQWTPTEMEQRSQILADRALEIWPTLEVDSAAIEKAKQAELRELAERRDVAKVPMSAAARELFETLRPRIHEVDPAILELAESKSVSYHAPGFFLEVLPRKHKLLLLLPLDHSEIEDPHGLSEDATEWKFLFYAKHEGGVLLRIKDEQDIEHAMPIIRQAYSLAAPASPDGLVDR